MNRSLLLWGSVALVAALLLASAMTAGVVWLLWPPPPGVSRENFRRLHEGMTEAEVQAILGPGERNNWSAPWPSLDWRANDVYILISFQNGKANMGEMRFGPPGVEILAKGPPTLVERLIGRFPPRQQPATNTMFPPG